MSPYCVVWLSRRPRAGPRTVRGIPWLAVERGYAVSGFATTRWSVILQARQPETARGALETICSAYRGPVLTYLHRQGFAKADAEDLTQEFFAGLLERRWDTRAEPARGRFRSFLLTALQHFVIDTRAKADALKRGGGQRRVVAEGAVDLIAAPESESPEQAFDRAWARTVLERCHARLEAEARLAGKQALYERLRVYIAEPSESADYRRLGEELGMRPNTIAVSVHRLRARLRELVREELTETIQTEADLHAELHDLRAAFGHVAQ